MKHKWVRNSLAPSKAMKLSVLDHLTVYVAPNGSLVAKCVRCGASHTVPPLPPWPPAVVGAKVMLALVQVTAFDAEHSHGEVE